MKNFEIYDTPVSPSIFANMRPIYKELEYVDPIDPNYLSRYRNTYRIVDENLGITYHETYIKRDIPETENDIYITVDSRTKNRLDVIANDYYQYSLYWWIIAIANNINNPFDVPEGTVLRLPPVSSVYLMGGEI